MINLCPKCARPAKESQTRYGIRHDCCGLHSWGGKPLVTPQVLAARQRFHAVFDPLWQDADTFYDLKEPWGSADYERAARRIQRTARNRAYHWLAARTGLPEPECHGAKQTDLRKLDALIRAARACTGPEEIRNWSKRGGLTPSRTRGAG